jgi:hypothetical protein
MPTPSVAWRPIVLYVASLLAAAILAAPAANGSGTLPDLRGGFNAYGCGATPVAQCEASPPANPTQFSILTEDFGTGAITGSGSDSSGDTWSISGAISNGATVTCTPTTSRL